MKGGEGERWREEGGNQEGEVEGGGRRGEGGGVGRGGGRYCSCNFICCHCCACSVWRGASAFSEPCELCLVRPFLQMSVFHHAIGLVRILDHGFPAEKVDILDAEEDEVCLSLSSFLSLPLSLSVCVCGVCVQVCICVCVEGTVSSVPVLHHHRLS